ncbi:MAG: helicase-related protein, partial [Sulfobacillus thermotolerans]|nr:helicase-related protein [Sulfobacillus thermotolerans]
TEARDTLRYLMRRLEERLGSEAIATIVGEQSMEQRHQQVEFFRDRAVVMLATDAGGESINLQFCRQMINYDIPWNPNRLEQRMGRIHRIGQTREVVVFNMVAANTREGDVLQHLLWKMEQMAHDLGEELVYNFLGDILEGRWGSLAAIMEDCIMGRQSLDEIVAGLDRTLSEEHQRLLELTERERLYSDTVDLPQLRTEQFRLIASHLPDHVYSDFTQEVFRTHGIALSDSTGHWEVGRIPRAVRDALKGRDGDMHWATMRSSDIDRDSPLYLVADQLASESTVIASTALTRAYATPEPLDIAGFQISVVDGNGQEIFATTIHWARRITGQWIRLDPYWWFAEAWTTVRTTSTTFDIRDFERQALRTALSEMNRIRQVREVVIDKKTQYLRRAFDGQYQHLLERLTRYQSTNNDNRNSALINQATVRLRELESRRRTRLDRLDRERAIQIRPIRALYTVHLNPSGEGGRIIPQDWELAMQEYVLNAGYRNLTIFPAFGLVDFYAETAAGEPVYMIGNAAPNGPLQDRQLRDAQNLGGHVIICELNGGGVTATRPVV